ncbi:MAG: hypothetical protein GY719_41415 [bacterium]|nr:hypothetical protein [bacterium]
MNDPKLRPSTLLLVGLMLMLTAGAALGQLQTGNLYGKVTDTQGEALPGVTVTLTGPQATQVQVTNAEGQFRFLSLGPGKYQMTAELEGFSTVEYPNVTIAVGRNTTIEVQLSAAVEETITVTSEAPLLDERNFTRGTNIDSSELDQIPTARDPWSLLAQAPAVVIDRINVGGNESGQQSNFLGAGSQGIDNTFSVDGVILTDMAATGASLSYYDFGAFEEVQFTIGSSDVSIATSGVTVNQVTKRGGNQWAASGRYLRTDGDLQESANTLPSGDKGNEIDVVEEFGAEIGGPLWKDHLWFWAGYGESDIGNIVIGGQLDRTMLEDFNTKLNFQGTQSNSGVLHFWTNDKLKSGRGAGPNRSPETTHNQITPADIWKFEDTHIFGSNFFVTGLWSNNDGVFNAAPQGGRDADVFWDAGGVLHGSYWDFAQNGVIDQWRVDASYFFNTGGASHELKFGGGFREQENLSSTVWPGNKMVYSCEFFGCDDQSGETAFVQFWRNKSLSTSSTYESAWVQDTVTTDRWTFNFGLRYDVQDVESLASTSLANPDFSDLLPELTFGGNDAGGFEWETIVPRVGVTYALGEERRTLLRGSFSQYAEQLGHSQAQRTNPVGYAYAAFYFTDANRNLVLDADETGSLDYYYYYNFSADDPLALSTPNVTDPNLDPTMTDELTFGVEHGFTPNFSGGVTVTYRNITDIPETRILVDDGSGVRQVVLSDWVQDDFVCPDGCQLPDGSTVTNVPVWNLRDGVSSTGGRIMTNGDKEQDYLGVTFNATKRLSNRWRLAGHFTWSDWDVKVGPDFVLHDNPTDTLVDFTNDLALQDGNEPFAERSAGSGDKGDIWAGSSWTFNINTLYQVAADKKWGFNVGASLTGREGFVSPPYASNALRVQLADFDRFRNDDVISLDARIEKDFEFKDFGFTLGIDGFNLSNEDYVLQRQRNLFSDDANQVRELLSPRVFRLGVKLHFR